MDTTSIIQWNVQGIQQRKDEILELSKSFQASIIAAQETFLWENANFKIPNFNCLRKDGHFNVRGHGGVALFIRENIPYKEITLSTTLTAIAAQITINSTFTICNIYIPPSCLLACLWLSVGSDDDGLPSPLVCSFVAQKTDPGGTYSTTGSAAM